MMNEEEEHLSGEAKGGSKSPPSSFEIAVAVANKAEKRCQEAKEARSEAKMNGFYTPQTQS
jgi:hypothetical protein